MPLRVPHLPDTDPNHSWQCKQHALFFHGYGFLLEFIAPLVFSLMAMGITVFITSITPGVNLDLFKKATSTSPTIIDEGVEMTDMPDLAARNFGVEDTEPPAYDHDPQTFEPLVVEPATEVVEDKFAKPKYTSAQAFVIVTFLQIPILACFFFAALAVESLTYCQFWSPVPIGWQIFWWILFSLPCLFSTLAISCWAMLFLDLGGRKRREKIMPHGETTVLFLMGCLVSLPFVLLWLSVGMGSVKVVEWCQRRCCPGGLEDEETEIGAVRSGEEISEESVVPGEEENVGLLNGVEK